jgi:hypothetical protein
VILSSLSNLFKRNRYQAIKTFTYYLPSPPERKTGYQEKEFDQITAYLLGKNFEILDIKMQACANEKTSGVWILCLLGAKTLEAKNFNLEIDYHEISSQKKQAIELDPSIEHDD